MECAPLILGLLICISITYQCAGLSFDVFRHKFSCPPNSTNTLDYLGSCYQFLELNKSWTEAKNFCESSASNGVLVNYLNYDELEAIKIWLSDSVSDLWIGGYINDYSYVNKDNDTQPPLNFTESSDLPHAANEFLLDRYAQWYWTDRQNSNTTLMLYRPDRDFPLTGDGPCVAWSPICDSRSRNGKYKAVNCSLRLPFICKYGCLHTIDTGELTDISASYSLETVQNCEWDINVGEGSAILEFDRFYITGQCHYSYLMVYESRNSTTPLAKLCGSDLPHRIISPSHTLFLSLIVYRTVSSILDRSDYHSLSSNGFHGTVRSSSGGHHTYRLEEMHGIVSTFLFPEPYFNNVSTAWLINVPIGAVNLMFTEVDIQPGSNISLCDHDQLQIRENSSDGQLLATLCGSELPDNFTSTTGTLYLHWVTDNSVVRSGFRAVYWSSEAECVSVIISSHGIIESPGYPEYYLPNTRCVWYIDVGSGVARFNFNAFDLPPSFSDYVEVLDGRNTKRTLLVRKYNTRYRDNGIATFSQPSKLKSKSRYMTVFFQSDRPSRKQARGFQATFQSSTNCSYNLRRPIGNISSPDFPSYYEALSNCTWVIDVLSGNATLKLKTFDFQHSFGCEHDRFEVHDGNSSLSPQIAGSPFCGSSLPDVIVGSSQYLFIRMYTNSDSSIALGFTGDYWSSDYRCHMWGSEVDSFSYKDKCYGFARSGMAWPYARSYCESKGTSLYYIESKLEDESIRKTIFEELPAFRGSFWTGGHRRVVSSSELYWSTPQEDIKFNQNSSDISWGAVPLDDWISVAHIYMTSAGLRPTRNSYREEHAFLCKESPTRQVSRVDCSTPPQSVDEGSLNNKDNRCHMWDSDAQIFSYKDKCYGFVRSAMHWPYARSYCESKGTSLYYIESKLEDESIRKTIFDKLPAFSRSFWTGGYRRVVSSGELYWSTPQEDIRFNRTSSVVLWESAMLEDHIYSAIDDSYLVYIYMSSAGLGAVEAYPFLKMRRAFLCKESPTRHVSRVDCSTPPQATDEGSVNNKDYTTALAVSLTIICLLVIAIVVGVVCYRTKLRSRIRDQPLLEMN